MAWIEIATVGNVLDANGEPLDALRQAARNEKLVVSPAAIAGDDVVLRGSEFRRREVVSLRPAVDARVAPRRVPLADRLPGSVAARRPDGNAGPLIRVLVVELPSEHDAEVVRVQLQGELAHAMHDAHAVLLRRV